tara:strand:+ start:6184 stop:6597 length:414 start_codon:yes stop_codon:yes gene_type:complete
MNKPILIAKRINKMTKVDVFDNTRKSKVVEARSLLVFILYKYEKMKLQNIASFLEENGKSSDHSSVLHALRMFEIYLKGNKRLGQRLTMLTKNIRDVDNIAKKEFIKLKVNYLSDKSIDKMVALVDTMEQKELNENT